jgi:hypothetical protein
MTDHHPEVPAATLVDREGNYHPPSPLIWWLAALTAGLVAVFIGGALLYTSIHNTATSNFSRYCALGRYVASQPVIRLTGAQPPETEAQFTRRISERAGFLVDYEHTTCPEDKNVTNGVVHRHIKQINRALRNQGQPPVPEHRHTLPAQNAPAVLGASTAPASGQGPVSPPNGSGTSTATSPGTTPTSPPGDGTQSQPTTTTPPPTTTTRPPPTTTTKPPSKPPPITCINGQVLSQRLGICINQPALPGLGKDGRNANST